MEVYDSDDFEVELKSDNSPLTKADKAANQIIVAGLKKISEYPIISEEGEKEASSDGAFWLVDPVDGTKEFVKRNGEFTVNIGLIKNSAPVLGVVLAPAKELLYFGAEGQGAFKQEDDEKPVEIKANFTGDVPVVFASRSHRDENMDKFLEELGEHKEMNMGSSLKICLVADGTAALYPRFAPTMLWDTAAAHAILNAAGGTLKQTAGQPLPYNPAELTNPFFIARTTNWQ